MLKQTRIALLGLLTLFTGCTFSVRAAAGPALDQRGGRGGVVTVSVGVATGSTRAGLGIAAEHASGVGNRATVERSVAPSLYGYGSFGESARLGLAGHLGLVFGRAPQEYRDRAGLTLGVGARLRLAGKMGRSDMGSCGPINEGDRWGLFLAADVAYDLIDSRSGRVSRASFPVGLELRVNVFPSSPTRSYATDEFAEDEPDGESAP